MNLCGSATGALWELRRNHRGAIWELYGSYGGIFVGALWELYGS
jgi:hypothetical protein